MRIWALVIALAACSSPKPPVQPPQPQPMPDRPPAAKPAESIGTATMLDDGTIQMHLVARGDGGMVGDALINYPPNHPQYQYIIDHLGPMKPGETKPVAPFPE
jgi:hypothetical protein